MEVIVIENITWIFRYAENDDINFLGEPSVKIPKNMIKRFVKECKWNELNVPPHYHQEDLNNGLDFKSDFIMDNPDSLIVLMNWLHKKKRKYVLDYKGTDPFWIYHDYFHSKNDVYGTQVNGITGHVEHARIFQGLAMAEEAGVMPKVETLAQLCKSWERRFPEIYLNKEDFHIYIKEEELEMFEIMSIDFEDN